MPKATQDHCPDGRPHQLEVYRRAGVPPCQPLRDFVRQASERWTTVHGTHALADEWECFHQEACMTCRKKTRTVLHRADCPDAP